MLDTLTNEEAARRDLIIWGIGLALTAFAYVSANGDFPPLSFYLPIVAGLNAYSYSGHRSIAGVLLTAAALALIQLRFGLVYLPLSSLVWLTFGLTTMFAMIASTAVRKHNWEHRAKKE